MDPVAEAQARKRLQLFARLCLVWAVVIVARLLWLQIVEHDRYARMAEQQQQRKIEIRAPRGTIFDRDGHPMAMSVPVDSVFVNPLLMPDRAIAADLLARVLHLDREELLTKIDAAVKNRRGFLWVKRKISLEESERLRSYHFDWIAFETESSRFYPSGALAAHVLGGVDHEERGNGGVEQYLDKELRGKPGVMRTTADVRHNVFDRTIFSDPRPGAQFTLTIDQRIQYVAEYELAKAVKEHGASTGSIVAMDPRSGEILAMANYPSYNPNEAPKNKSDAEGRKNLAVTAPFEPGSVFKVITLSAGLETTRMGPETPIFCNNGAFTLFRRVIHDSHPHGTLTMAGVLAKSSNIGAIKVGLAAGNENLYKYVKAFGFGSRTGLPLPGESGGLVRRLERWIPSSIGSVAMGHEISTTTVQLARACSVIANGGLLVKPRLIRRIEREGQPVVETKLEYERILKPENAIRMRMMMRGVVDFGTGKTGARLRGYSSAGKTGSAQIYDYKARVYTHRYNGSFMGFAPVNNPAIVVAVTLNNTPTGSRGFGGVVAAPVFNKVTTAALRFLDVPRDLPDEPDPDSKESQPESDLAVAEGSIPPDAEQDDAGVIREARGPATVELPPQMLPIGPRAPDYRGKTKREVVSSSLESGIGVQLAGSGVARSQIPSPGAVLQPGERVRVVFSR